MHASNMKLNIEGSNVMSISKHAAELSPEDLQLRKDRIMQSFSITKLEEEA